MPDSYNPDEIVKCKHLNELARQLNIKLDGATDPKPTIKNGEWKLTTGTNHSYSWNGTDDPWEVSIPVSRVANSAQTAMSLQIRLRCSTAALTTEIADFTTEGGDGVNEFVLQSTQWTGPAGSAWMQGMWYSAIQCTAVFACTVRFNIKTIPTPQYDGITLPVIVHIYDDSQS